jgi:biofilm protein TabA
VEVNPMIFGTIQNIEMDRRVLPAALARGLEYLHDTDFARVETGRYEIDGTSIFALVQEYQTAPKGEKKPEAHRKYIDIQYVFKGSEIIGYGLDKPANEISEDRLAEKDLLFYRSVRNEMDLILTPGMYVILFPQDVHRPGCSYGNGERVKKVVVKIRLDLL